MSEAQPGPSGCGTVVLELGADAGALILYTPASLDGREIEISRRDGHRTHSRVRRRGTRTAVRYAAVYPGLAAGDYTIHCDGWDRAVTVKGGEVASSHWSQ